MAETIFTSQTPVNTDANDATAYTLGTTCYSDEETPVAGIEWRFPDTPIVGTVVGALYDYSTEALLASANFDTQVAGQKNRATFSAVENIPADTPVIAAIHTPNRYVFTANFFTAAGVDNEQLHAPQDNTDPLGIGNLRNGRLNVGPALAYPGSTSGNQSCFFVDIFTAAGSVDGTLIETGPAATEAMSGDTPRTGQLAETGPAASEGATGDVPRVGVLAETGPAALDGLVGDTTATAQLTETGPAATETMFGASQAVTLGALLAMPTTTVTIYAPSSAPDEWSGERVSDGAVASGVAASIIEQARTVNDPRTGTPRVVRQVTGRVPDGCPVEPTSRIVDAENRTYAVGSVRQARNPMWVGDVVLELYRTDQASP